MEQGTVIDGYEIVHSIFLDAMTHAVAQKVKSEDAYYRVYKIGPVNALGLADYETVYENHDYLNTMREFTKWINAALDSLGLDQAYRDSPNFADAPLRAVDCFTEDMDLEGQVIAVRTKALAPEFRTASYQLHIATGGFGCTPNARGQSVFCKNIYNGDKEVRFDRYNIIGVVKPESIPEWAKEKIEKLQADKPSVINEIKQSNQKKQEHPTQSKNALTRKKVGPDL